jgi:hypothetical protein
MEIKRGDVVICAAPGDYGKPRPAVVVQSDLFNGGGVPDYEPSAGRASFSHSCACRKSDRSEAAVAGDG